MSSTCIWVYNQNTWELLYYYLGILKYYTYYFFQIANHDWFGAWIASDQQLHFILESLNYSSLYDFTQGQFSIDTMDFWYWMQKPEIRKAMNLGNRSMSDGLEIYKAMIEDTMQSVKTELVEAMNNYKVSVDSSFDCQCHCWYLLKYFRQSTENFATLSTVPFQQSHFQVAL